MAITSISVRTQLLILTLALVLGGASLAKPAQADEASDQRDSLRKLFSERATPYEKPARHTFVFWINGDADHFSTATGAAEDSSDVTRSDKFDRRRIEALAQSCTDCNVILFHDQRGHAAWYTADAPWAVYLKVYARGVRILNRTVNEIDQGDPRVLAELLDFAEDSFPDSQLHLIYRGHSFRAAYPGAGASHAEGRVAAFDYSHPQTPYGTDAFVTSIRRARLKRPLASITLAACSMATLEMARALAPFTRYLVASQIDVLETLDVGFRFESILQVTDRMDERQASHLIASRMLEPFRKSGQVTSAMMEYSATWMDLRDLSEIERRWNQLQWSIQSLPAADRQPLVQQAQARSSVAKGVSRRYLEHLRAQGKSEAAVRALSQLVRVPSLHPGDYDLGLYLLALSAQPHPAIARAANDLIVFLAQGRLLVWDASPAGIRKSGLSVTPRLE